eukprot:8186831-Alexandrium_andersonii.AAC.1
MTTGEVQRTKKVAEAIAHAMGTLAVVLVGPSSSGKTVMARSIAKLYSASHGCHGLGVPTVAAPLWSRRLGSRIGVQKRSTIPRATSCPRMA